MAGCRHRTDGAGPGGGALSGGGGSAAPAGADRPGFREICEEYALAQESLARFEARPDAAERPEIGDYRTVIAELESEIDRFLREAEAEGLTTRAEERDKQNLAWPGGLGGTPEGGAPRRNQGKP